MSDLGYENLDRRAFAGAFRKVLACRDSGILLAEDDGEPCGLLAWSLRPMLHLAGPVFSIDELVVAGPSRGLGAGQRLLKAALLLARRRGAVRVELLTNRRRESYRRGFYLKNGFSEVDSAVFRMPVSSDMV